MTKPEDKVKIEGEVAFPVFKFEATYVDADDKIKTTQDLIMLPAGTTEEMSYARLLEWWHNGKTYKKLGIFPTAINSTYIKHETWMLVWFSHFTYDVGQSDADVLINFKKFVDRAVEKAESFGLMRDDGVPELMGAEDRYRWGGKQDEETQEQTPAPCRCEDCKKHGQIIISH